MATAPEVAALLLVAWALDAMALDSALGFIVFPLAVWVSDVA
jgi:hypothetical protein